MDLQEVDRLAKKIWDYMLMNHQLKKSDCILVLGSHDIRVAERGAQLFLEGWAPLLIMSGGIGRLTQEFPKPEAEVFTDIAVKMGVPRDKIILENRSSNTSENILFTKKLLTDKGIDPRSFILVQKPYMERRAYATFMKRWPGKEVIVTSPQIPFEEYPNEKYPKEEVLNIVVGDLQRIKVYAEKGFAIPQEIPNYVSQAYEKLVQAGYTKHLIKD